MIPAIKQYRKHVARHLHCCRDTKERLLLSFDSNMLAPLLDNTDQPSYEYLCASFGTPDKAAALLTEQVSEEEAVRYCKQQKLRKAILIGAVAAVMVAVLAFALYVFIWKELTIIEITDSGPIE